MTENNKEIETLDGMDTGLLHSRGWHLVTYFQTHEQSDPELVFGKALKRAEEHNRQAGIRSVEKNGKMYFEIWDFWK